jgi:hypothetical protein
LQHSLDKILSECLSDPDRADSISRDDARKLYARLNDLSGRLLMRSMADADDNREEVLTVGEAAKFANVSTSLLYERHHQMSSAMKIGRAVRFKKSELLADLAALGGRADNVEPIRRASAIPYSDRRLRAASRR